MAFDGVVPPAEIGADAVVEADRGLCGFADRDGLHAGGMGVEPTVRRAVGIMDIVLFHKDAFRGVDVQAAVHVDDFSVQKILSVQIRPLYSDAAEA